MDVLFTILFSFSTASVNGLQCNSSSYQWAINSNGHDPCQLFSMLRDSCVPGNVDPLQPLSYSPSGMNYYPGPTSSIQNSCSCSYVMYNLMAACSHCQIGISSHALWPTYIDWAASCDLTNMSGIYPDVLPSSFRHPIPGWAQFSARDSDDSHWNYGLSRALASGDVLARSEPVNCFSAPSCSIALPIGTAFAGLLVGLFIAALALFLQRRRRAHVIPPPTRYHTAPDNTPLFPLVPRAAHAHGTSFLRRMLEVEQENDPHRIEPFDISTAVGGRSFPPHPAVFPPQRDNTFPPAVSIPIPSQVPTRVPSRQTSRASLNASPLTAHSTVALSHSHSHKTHSRPHTSNSFFSAAESPVAGPSRHPLHDLSSSEPPSPLPPDRTWPHAPENPPAYKPKS